ncbi:hypothetical protein [Priestia taiwanensis]|uniref:Uncharacterized protein n=1 Tax=Priestia taiwanensis TaxID=1347902 RepID=A0A917ASS0_9BACI|nr:hypothetical protein [Priestia taiwanensis]MBM7363082.1 small-conductance mechanosensitive channel [Priestia taiwanensis]GGE67556.1 hypothetical protein GCM10007140_17030 [Priestia taiwanensis]
MVKKCLIKFDFAFVIMFCAWLGIQFIWHMLFQLFSDSTTLFYTYITFSSVLFIWSLFYMKNLRGKRDYMENKLVLLLFFYALFSIAWVFAISISLVNNWSTLLVTAEIIGLVASLVPFLYSILRLKKLYYYQLRVV